MAEATTVARKYPEVQSDKSHASSGVHNQHEGSSASTICDDNSVDINVPPRGLERQYQTMYNLLSGCILEKNNPVAFLIGPRGCGKHFVLDSCLQSLQNQRLAVSASAKTNPTTTFRVVRLSGLLLRGDDAAAGREIVHQLSSFANLSTVDDPMMSLNNNNSKKRQRDGSVSAVASFHSYVSLLDEMLQRSRIDGIPILIVISDVEAFASGNSVRVEKQAMATAAVSGRLKQILLYHLLDMASSEKTYMGIVAITTRLNFFDMLEKRIRSRAFGAQAVIQFTKQRPNTYNTAISTTTNTASSHLSTEYQDLIFILTQHLRRYYLRRRAEAQAIIDSLEKILLNAKDPICVLFYRQLCLGKSVRWFIRVLTVSYSIMMGSYGWSLETKDENNSEDAPHYFTQQHLLDALVTMGCDVTEAYKEGLSSTLLHHDVGDKPDANGKSRAAEISKTVLLKASNNYRLQPLYDASASQLVLIFSARRLLVKDSLSPPTTVGGDSASGGNNNLHPAIEVDYVRPLTFERMYREYHDKFVKTYSVSYNNATGNHQRKSTSTATFSSLIFPQRVLVQAYLQLLECDVFRPSMDHTGGGLASYDFAKLNSSLALANLDEIANMPVHLTIEIDEELTPALQQSDALVECITVLKDWGMKGIS